MPDRCWAILEIEPTSDRRAIKRAYSKLLKSHPPEGDAEAFQRLHGAYKQALRLAPVLGPPRTDATETASSQPELSTTEREAIVAMIDLPVTAQHDPAQDAQTPPPSELTQEQREHINAALADVDALLRQHLRSSQPSAWQFLESHELLDPAYRLTLGTGVLKRILAYEREQHRIRPKRPNLIGDQVIAFLNQTFLWSTRLEQFLEHEDVGELWHLKERLRILAPTDDSAQRGGKLVRKRELPRVSVPTLLKDIAKRLLGNLGLMAWLFWVCIVIFLRWYEPDTPENIPQGLAGVPVLEQQLENVRAAGNNTLRESILLDRLAKAYLDSEQLDTALDYAHQALALASSLTDRKRKLDANWRVGSIYSRLGRHAESIPYYETALEVAQRDGQRRAEGTLLALLGYAYSTRDDRAGAKSYLTHALTIAREFDDKAKQLPVLKTLGDIAASEQRHDDAIEYYREGLAVAEDFGDRTWQVAHLTGVADAHENKGDIDRALALFDEAVSRAQEIGTGRPVVATLINRGLVHMRLNQPAQALGYFERAYRWSLDANYPSGVASAQCRIGGAYAAKGNSSEGLSFVREGLALAQDLEDTYVIERCEELLRSIEAQS